MDGEEGGGPVSTFQSLAAEGDILYKQGEIRKAIDAYSKALQLRPTDRNILVQRSKCALQINDPEAALRDAETALAEDKNFYKARLQKAEALYAKGEFEMALVYYHRGHIAKPEVDEFRLGIQKASEAIENSIGDPTLHKLRVPPKESHRAQTAAAGGASSPSKRASPTRRPVASGKPGESNGNGGASTAAAAAASGSTADKAAATRPSGSADASAKALLGELYADKEYLQKLFEDKDLAAHANSTVSELVKEGLAFLETRTEFWRQQKPLYARKKEAAKLHEKVKEARARQSDQKERDERERAERQRASEGQRGVAIPYIKAPPNNSDASIAKFVAENRDNIARFQAAGDLDSALKAAKLYQNTIANMTFAAKDATLCEVYDLVGALHFSSNNMPQALLYYNKELQLARGLPASPAASQFVSKSLGNLGRCYVRQRKYTSALEAWLEKLPLAETALERVWLRNDMGRCYLEIGDVRSALEQGEAAVADAEETGDAHWKMNISVLLAQAHERQGDLSKAKGLYEAALQLARDSGDAKATESIGKVLAAGVGSSSKQKSGSADQTEPSATAAAENDYVTSSDKQEGDDAAQERAPESAVPQRLTSELKQDSQRRSSEGISLVK